MKDRKIIYNRIVTCSEEEKDEMRFNLKNYASKLKMEGKKFKHKNGNVYTILHLTNTDNTIDRQKRHPIQVVYQGEDGKVWSRELEDWNKKFTEVKTAIDYK